MNGLTIGSCHFLKLALNPLKDTLHPTVRMKDPMFAHDRPELDFNSSRSHSALTLVPSSVFHVNIASMFNWIKQFFLICKMTKYIFIPVLRE